MPTAGDLLSIISSASSFTYQAAGAALGTYKSSPEAMTQGFPFPGERRRILWNWNSTKAWSSSNNIEWILGYHAARTLDGVGTIVEASSVDTGFANCNGFYPWFKVNAVTNLESGIIDVNGDRVYADGTNDGSASTPGEQITIDATGSKVYKATNCYQGNVELAGNNPGAGTMSLSLDAGGVVDAWNHGGMIRVMEGIVCSFRPSASTWRFDVTVYSFTVGTGAAANNGLTELYAETFQNTDSPTRAQNGSIGRCFNTEINTVVDPSIGEGFLIVTNQNSIDYVDVWASFYEK